MIFDIDKDLRIVDFLHSGVMILIVDTYIVIY